MLMIQTAPPDAAAIPWWVLYVLVLGATWLLFRLARSKGARVVPLGCLAFVPLWIVALLALPDGLWLLTLALAVLPLLGALVGSRWGGVAAPPLAGAPHAPRVIARIPKELMAGQPRAESVLRSRIMRARFVAGLPADTEFVARMRYVSGIGKMTPRPVDLLMGGGRLWMAPLTRDVDPFPIPARDVLRVDVWPELEGPPTLRVSWSPPAGELTAEVVLGAMANVPPHLVAAQIEAVAGVLTAAIGEEAREAEREELAAMAPIAVPPPAPGVRACRNCGETVPPGRNACPRCATPA
ncbi:MAG TPA: hypothetical protein VEX86_25085 [Longimicrobium sp.]|nr:hypothetical protein [Longimicrobium sp.]